MLEAQPDFDPHDLKHEGAKTQRSAHVNEPYVFQQFPQLVHKDGDIITVNNQEELDKALADGYTEEPVIVAEEPVSALEPTHVVIDNADPVA